MSRACEVDHRVKGETNRFGLWSFWKPFVTFGGGALAGALYYYFLAEGGQWSGFTADPFSSALFGGLIGFYLFGRSCSSCR